MGRALTARHCRGRRRTGTVAWRSALAGTLADLSTGRHQDNPWSTLFRGVVPTTTRTGIWLNVQAALDREALPRAAATDTDGHGRGLGLQDGRCIGLFSHSGVRIRWHELLRHLDVPRPT